MVVSGPPNAKSNNVRSLRELVPCRRAPGSALHADIAGLSVTRFEEWIARCGNGQVIPDTDRPRIRS